MSESSTRHVLGALCKTRVKLPEKERGGCRGPDTEEVFFPSHQKQCETEKGRVGGGRTARGVN